MLEDAARLDERIRSGEGPGPMRVHDRKRREVLQVEIADLRRLATAYLQDALLDSPCHEFDRPSIEVFRGAASRENLVFIMTKFPEHGDAQAPALEQVIEAVRGALIARGREPRLATVPYKDLLWHNVALHMVGCGEGIAIVEDRYRPELNPNVAIEWGYMRGSGRRVRFLKEQSFHHLRADFAGRITENFDWADPVPGIHAAVGKWFP